MKHPLVSLGLPVYNGSRFLPRTLQCLLDQDYRDFELIISDNGSTDATADICRRFASQDSRIRYLRNRENIGAAPNYELVLNQARGRFFKWCSHDDLCHPRLLSSCMDAFDDAAEAVVLVYPLCDIIDEADRVLGAAADRIATQSSRPHQRLRHVLRNTGHASSMWGLLRTSSLRTTALTSPVAYWDCLLLAELSLIGHIREVPEVLLQQRAHPGNAVSLCSDPRAAAIPRSPDALDRGTRERLRAWANPRSAPKRFWLPLHLERCLEYIRRVLHTRLPVTERALCVVTVVTVFYELQLRKTVGRWRAGLRGALPRTTRFARQ